MLKLHYDYKGVGDIKRKLDAAVELFGIEEVTVRLTGTWKDKTGEAVFFDVSASAPIDHVSTVYVYVDVDNGVTGCQGIEGKSKFIIIKQ